MKHTVVYMDGVTLADDALLYEIQGLQKILGDLVPGVTDEGTRCVYELEGCKDAAAVPDMLKRLEDAKDEVSLRQAEVELRRASEKLKCERENHELRFPGQRLSVPDSGHYLLGRCESIGQTRFGVFILCGLTRCGDATPGIDATRWLASEAGRVAGICERLENERLEMDRLKGSWEARERQEAEQLITVQERVVRRRKARAWVGFLILAGVLAFGLWSKQTQWWLLFNGAINRLARPVANSTSAR